jgi:hypothetical protein
MRYITKKIRFFNPSLYYLELKLNEFGDSQANPPCNASDPTSDQLCADLYRGNTKFCKQGECRCISNSAYYENNKCGTLKLFER